MDANLIFACHFKCRNAEGEKPNLWKQWREESIVSSNMTMNRLHFRQKCFMSERFTWKKELQQARLELDKARLDFEVKRLEAEERRAQESLQIMVQFLQLLKPPMPYYGSVPPYNYFHGAVPPGNVADLMFPSGAPMPPAPSTVPQHNQVDWLNLQNPQ